MSTFIPKAQELERKWYLLDAANKPLGETAVKAAVLLRGKDKPIFTPNVDCGDFVVIINAKDAVLTGKKLTEKKRYHHTGWIGNMKEISYETLMANNPEKAMMYAIKGMIPDNTLGRKALTRVRIYKDANHEQTAQKPIAVEF